MSGVGGDRFFGGFGGSNPNLMTPGAGSNINNPQSIGGKKAQFTCYKLLVDPALVKGAAKLYRFDGNVPEDPCYPPITLRDPRNSLYLARLRNRSEGLDLPVPRFKIDANYVGTPPPLEVTITNINDNVDKTFLKDLVQKIGSIEDIQIYYHPVTKKHLGLGRIVFEHTKGAKMCVEKMNGKSVMGQVLDAFVDPFGTKCKVIYEDLIVERPKEIKPKVDKNVKNELDKPTETPKSTIPPPCTPSSHSSYSNSQSSGHSRVHSAKQEYTPSSDMGYGTANSENSNYSETSSLKSSYPSSYGNNQYNDGYNNVYNHHHYPGMRQAPPNPSFNSPNTKQGNMWPLNAPPPPTYSSVNDSKTEDNGGLSPKMDLDTRIKMLLGGKDSAHSISMLFGLTDDESEPEQPAKIQRSSRKRKTRVSLTKNEIWGSESEDDETPEDKFAKKFKRNTFVPVDGQSSSHGYYQSPPPSPFLSLSKPRNNGIRASTLENDLDQISDDSTELPGSKRDDDMSLSSLSPEDPSTIRLPPPSLPPGPPPIPPADQPCVPHIPSYPPPPMHNFYPGAPQYSGSHISEQQMQYSSSAYYAQWNHGQAHSLHIHQQNQHHYYSHYQIVPPPPPPESQAPQENQEVEEKDTPQKIISTVLDRLVEELKQILKRDFQKRMIENVAYKSFENWWSENEKQQKEQQASKSSTVTTTEPPAPDPTTISNFKWTAGRFIEQDKPLESTFSLGLKASIPKLPSFRMKRKIRTPSPTLDEDSRRSLDDSDLEESKSSSDSRARARGRRPLSLSSEQSSSESSSSDSDSSSSDWDSSSESLESFSDKELVFSDKEKSDSLRDLLLETESISDESTHSKSQTSTPRHPMTPEPLDEDEDDEKCRIVNQTDNLVQNLSRIQQEDDDTLLSQEDAIRETDKLISELATSKEPDRMEESGGEDESEKEPEIASYLLDHDYCIKWSPQHAQELEEGEEEDESIRPQETMSLAEELRNFKKDRASNKAKALAATKAVKKLHKSFAPRNEKEELDITFEFLTKGIDQEDISYIKKSYELMLADDPENFWLNQTHWVDHPPTLLPTSKPKNNKRVHLTGSARTEGFYKLNHEEKQKHKLHLSIATAVTGRVGVHALSQDKPAGKMQTLSREARSNQRRLLTALGNDVESDLLKFNQLKFRKKSLRFARSCIHDWGLFAAEPIAADEMVIEYVGQMIRPIVADLRERKYEAVGIGSSYLFRIDLENIIDATRCGNLSRFINHSCSPNCYAKIIAIEGQKKIVIYSKQQIAMNEEITYDYKFPIEEEKITCLCGSSQCRGTLN